MRIGTKEISGDITLGNILSACATIGSLLTGVWWLSSHIQATDDHLFALDIRITHIEQSQTAIANSATQAATVVANTVERNEQRRDASDQDQRAAINRLTDRVQKLSDDLANQRHSELTPLPHLASNGNMTIWEH